MCWIRKCSKNNEDTSKGPRSQFEMSPTVQISDNMNIKMNIKRMKYN